MTTKKRDLNDIKLEDEIAEVKRELGLRRSVYPGLIKGAKMTKDDANWHYKVLEKTLRRLEMALQYKNSGIPLFIHFNDEKQTIRANAEIQDQESSEEVQGVDGADVPGR